MEISTIVALLALGAFGWWFYRRNAAATRRREEEDDEIGRHDHQRAHEMAKIQSDLQRWTGPW